MTNWYRAAERGLYVGWDVPPSRIDWFVYATSSLELARAYAVKWDRAVYRIAFDGDIEPDPDYAHVPGLCARCPLAHVLAVIAETVTDMTVAEANAVGSRYLRRR